MPQTSSWRSWHIAGRPGGSPRKSFSSRLMGKNLMAFPDSCWVQKPCNTQKKARARRPYVISCLLFYLLQHLVSGQNRATPRDPRNLHVSGGEQNPISPFVYLNPLRSTRGGSMFKNVQKRASCRGHFGHLGSHLGILEGQQNQLCPS